MGTGNSTYSYTKRKENVAPRLMPEKQIGQLKAYQKKIKVARNVGSSDIHFIGKKSFRAKPSPLSKCTTTNLTGSKKDKIHI